MFARKLVTYHAINKLVHSSYKTAQKKLLTGLSCTRHLHRTPETTKPKPLPSLIYFSNPLKHCWAKINMKMLQMTWDPQFCEEEFKKGACRVRIFDD